MSVENAPPFVVDGPRPQPPRYRLLDVANIIEETDEHWQAGAQVWGYPEDVPYTWDPCSTGTTRSKSSTMTVSLPEFGTFVVIQNASCTARSIFSAQEPGESDDTYQARMQQQFVDRALAVFQAAESYAVEREFATGHAQPLNPHLCDTNVTFPAGTGAVSPRVGLSYLADAVGATGRDGLIHAPPSVVVSWGLFRTYRDQNALFTVEGTPIAEGDGYIQVAPEPRSAPGAGKSWAFATGPVDIRRGPPIIYPGNIAQALSRSDNTVTWRVERVYLVDWDTALQATVLIDWTLTP